MLNGRKTSIFVLSQLLLKIRHSLKDSAHLYRKEFSEKPERLHDLLKIARHPSDHKFLIFGEGHHEHFR